ncbi:hydrogenase nickel incorporation protein HypA [Pyrofollis japonicus]|uniref:hydrogenase maturation nickel metallochaperone HypA/HybF n=1 Tax=Pyrofollis japonicus TaxID=3060460 RepID=UPI00295BCAFC|nr:hydrogenase/urease maturation nickel metallochaperone HypA [Pyrofollis japonicus]BEP18437.1 hydrogenase nickel incorporation protein HypA [Pyrofollis japonicus]
MHETSIALSILAAVEEVFNETPGAKRVSKIKLRIGMLSLIDVEALSFALKVASRGTPAENAEIEYTIDPPVFRCNRCGHTWSISEEELQRLVEKYGLQSAMHLHPDIITRFFKCPRCGSTDIEIEKGRGVIIESVEIETENE